MKYLLIILIFASCSTAQELMDKAEKKDPAIVANLARDKYPCKDLLKPDTTTIYQDSLIFVEVECPDTPVEIIKTDTVNNVITRTVRVPVNMPVQVKTVTRWYKDSAEVYLLARDLNQAQFANTKLTDDNAVLSKKVARKSKENWVWRIIALCLVGWQVVRLWGRITTFKIKQI